MNRPWEYLSVMWVRRVVRLPPPAGPASGMADWSEAEGLERGLARTPSVWVTVDRIYIHAPGNAEPTIHTVDQEQPEGTNLELSLFNELGNQGWELVSRETWSNPTAPHLGLEAVGSLGETRSLFKRQAA